MVVVVVVVVVRRCTENSEDFCREDNVQPLQNEFLKQLEMGKMSYLHFASF